MIVFSLSKTLNEDALLKMTVGTLNLRGRTGATQTLVPLEFPRLGPLVPHRDGKPKVVDFILGHLGRRAEISKVLDLLSQGLFGVLLY